MERLDMEKQRPLLSSVPKDVDDNKSPNMEVRGTREDRTTRPANKRDWWSVAFDLAMAILPLYLVGFAITAFVRDGTPLDSTTNMTLLRISQLNPTIFPLLFTPILAKFLKAVAYYHLERGVTVGRIQHILGSRSLVNSIWTPIKLREASYTVLLLILVWAFNPIGGQFSLRVVSRSEYVNRIDEHFLFATPGTTIMGSAISSLSSSNYVSMDSTFNTALITRDTYKNGTQDVFGNVHIPMLEYLQTDSKADGDGWYYIIPYNLTGPDATPKELPLTQPVVPPFHVSLLGSPFKVKLPVNDSEQPTPPTSTDIHSIAQATVLHFTTEEEYPTISNTSLQFFVETSYMYANCSFDLLKTAFDNTSGLANPAYANASFANRTDGWVTNTAGYFIDYDSEHSINSTAKRQLRVQHTITDDNIIQTDDDVFMQVNISRATCDMSTSYVEAEVYCHSQDTCMVSKIRRSKNATALAESHLTVLDGTSTPYEWAHPADPDSSSAMQFAFLRYPRLVAGEFFRNFINLTTDNPKYLIQSQQIEWSPLQAFFFRPDDPFAAVEGNNAEPRQAVFNIGSTLYSRRLTQLLNTYWVSATMAQEIQSGLTDRSADTSVGPVATMFPGRIQVQSIVLQCHKRYLVVLLLISLGLFLVGLATAYLDAKRRGPDIIDEFVYYLRHSPYVHDDGGSSMEDGNDMTKRMRNMVVQMGDVRPNDSVGLVAIATPTEQQPVERLDRGRNYY